MELSILIEPEATVHNTTVVDMTARYYKNSTVNRQFNPGERLQDNNHIYEFVHDTFKPTEYLLADETTYSLNQIIYKDMFLTKVTSLADTIVPQQPEDYTFPAPNESPNNSTLFNEWTCYWADLSEHVAFTADGEFTGFSIRTSDTIELQLNKDNNSTGWKFEVIYGDEDGFYIKHTEYNVRVYSSVDDETIILPAYSSSGSNYEWVGRTFILRGSLLYMRTGDGVDSPEEKTVPYPEFTDLDTIDNFPDGYWAKIGVTDPYKILDGKAHTGIIRANGGIWYSINIPYGVRYNTVSMTGVIADDVQVNYYDSNDEFVEATNIRPDNTREVVINGDQRLPDYPTTATSYCSPSQEESIAGGYLHFSLQGEVVEISGVFFGLSVDAGYTNLEFTNKFKDWSPKEIDDWGGVVYKEGVKQQIHSGSVDIPITSYDKMNRLMTSIGGSTVILNGSDSKDNGEADIEKGVFLSTVVVGRIKDFELKTKLKGKRMGDMATYTFSIEESI